MSAEFQIAFADPAWVSRHESEIFLKLEGLATFSGRSGTEIWLRSKEEANPVRRPYDVRVFIRPDACPMLEISAHPPAIESDLKSILAWLRSLTTLQVLDEDGEPAKW